MQNLEVVMYLHSSYRAVTNQLAPSSCNEIVDRVRGVLNTYTRQNALSALNGPDARPDARNVALVHSSQVNSINEIRLYGV